MAHLGLHYPDKGDFAAGDPGRGRNKLWESNDLPRKWWGAAY